MEYLIPGFSLLFTFGVVLWSFREVRRGKIIAMDMEKELRDQIKDRDQRLSDMLSSQSQDLRDWWVTARKAKELSVQPPPVVSNPRVSLPRQPVNGILPR